MFDRTSGELFYPLEYLHSVSHSIVDYYMDEEGNHRFTTRQQFLEITRNENELHEFAKSIVLPMDQFGKPTDIFAPIVKLNNDNDLNSVVSMSVDLYDFSSKIADSYIYQGVEYVVTTSGYKFNVADAIEKVIVGLPEAIISVLDELNIQ